MHQWLWGMVAPGEGDGRTMNSSTYRVCFRDVVYEPVAPTWYYGPRHTEQIRRQTKQTRGMNRKLNEISLIQASQAFVTQHHSAELFSVLNCLERVRAYFKVQ